MEEENNNNFEVISSKTSNANFKQNKQNKQNSFGKTVLIPFASGIVGCSLVIVTAFAPLRRFSTRLNASYTFSLIGI